jgi:hypothetical protein
VKIKDVIQESVYDFFTKGTAAQQQAASIEQDRQQTYRAANRQQALGQFKANPARTAPTVASPATSTTGADYVNLDPEVQVVSTVDPIVLKFNGKRYTRQPNGQWTKLGQTKPVDVPMQQFLSSELAKL